MDQTPTETIDTWGVLEIMGHVRVAGKIRTVAIGGTAVLRIDIPQEDGSLRTSYYGLGSLFGLHPTDEATARAEAERATPPPIHHWGLLSPGRARPRHDFDDLVEDEEYYGEDDDDDDEDEEEVEEEHNRASFLAPGPSPEELGEFGGAELVIGLDEAGG
jgi:hypothetical protein